MPGPKQTPNAWRPILASFLTLLVASTANAQRDSGYVPPEYHDGQTHYEQSGTKIGNFNIVRYIEDCRAVPIMHMGCWLTKEARLEWHDSSAAIEVAIVDNGGSVQLKLKAKSADGQTICLMREILVGYDPKPSTSENWAKLQPLIRQQLRGCNAITPSDLDRTMAEMRYSLNEYPAAAKAWKGVAAELFGENGRRCVAERVVKPIVINPRYECTMYSRP